LGTRTDIEFANYLIDEKCGVLSTAYITLFRHQLDINSNGKKAEAFFTHPGFN
jgi:hypothetical protein